MAIWGEYYDLLQLQHVQKISIVKDCSDFRRILNLPIYP